MAEYDKILPPPQFCQDVSWDPIHKRAPPKGIFDQEFGVPHFPEPGDRVWAEGARLPLGSSSWPGYARSRLFTTSAQALMQPSLWLLKQMWNELSVVRSERGRWTVSLDVNQFAPEEIIIKVKEDCLEITGKHDERKEEHGFVSRCFIRKYKLPANADVEHMTSYLSGDGVLSVEAPLPVPEDVVPEKTVISIQVEKEKGEEMDAQMEEHARKEEESDPADPFSVNRQASGEEPEYGDTAQQAPGVVPTEPVSGAGEEAGHPGGEHVSPEQQDEILPAGGVPQEPLKQKPIEDRDREEPQGRPMQREELGVVDSEASGDVAQEQLDEPAQEGALQKDGEGEFMEGPPEPSEERPPEEAKPDPAQSEKSQSPELEVLEGRDIEEAEEPPTKS